MTKIHHESYEALAEYVYNDEKVGLPLPPSVKSVFCHCDNIAQLFRENADHDPYILISAQSDFGPHYQSEHPVWADMIKWLHFLPPQITPELGYNGLNIGPRCNLQNCDITDKYSVKCYSFTRDTFPEIPKNVSRWFCTNSDIDETISIPFGAERQTIDRLSQTEEKSKLAYFNCVAYTYERYELWQHCRRCRWLTVKQNVSHEEFLQDLAEHSLVICPPSNGIDSYRIWQTLYMGSVPLVQRSRLTEKFSHLPIVLCDNLFAATADPDWLVEQAKEQYPKFEDEKVLQCLDLKYWAAEIQNSINSL